MGVDRGSDVIPAFEQVRCKGMAERVAGCPFDETELANGLPERLLQDGFIHCIKNYSKTQRAKCQKKKWFCIDEEKI